MGASSTVTLQDVVDYVTAQGSLAPVIPTGGYSQRTSLDMATDVMKDLLAERFNHKFNSYQVPPFYTISWQQDYCQIDLETIGWLESIECVDINNTALPKPIGWPQAVRDLQRTSWAASPPMKLSWEYNSTLYKGVWPGPHTVYTNPLGAIASPINPITNILDANGNILVLTQYGTTGNTAPVAAANAWTPLSATQINDGTCVWTVANPNGQGFRISPLPPQSAVTYQMNVRAQLRPPIFKTMQQLLTPLPDDYAGWFRSGYECYCYKNSPDTNKANQFMARQKAWLDDLLSSCKQGDRERDDARFIPDTQIMNENDGYDYGPANPYNWGYGSGR